MADEPGKLVLTTFDEIIDRIKSTRPLKSNGGTLTSGFVYSQLMLGMPIAASDYNGAYSPMGGVPFAAAVAAANTPEANEAAAAAARKSMEAAFKTSRLVDTMIMVSSDDTYHAYPAARRISLNYEGILRGIQPAQGPELAEDVKARVNDAMKVLYQLDADGNVVGKSERYKNYMRNALAYAQAKLDYKLEESRVLLDPATRNAGPAVMSVAQLKVDQAHDDLVAEGGPKIESALDTIAAVGISFQAHLTARSREIFDAWGLALSGVADPTLYAYITPSTWADPASTNDGWTELTIESSRYNSQSEFHSVAKAQGQFQSHYSRSEGGGGFSIFGFGAHAEGGNSEHSWSSTYQSSDGKKYSFKNASKNLKIKLEYALCTINRPWFIGDLFYMRDYYVKGTKKNGVSDGTIESQVNDERPLLPMIPVQFLAIRNVEISATAQDWGADGETLTSMYNDASAQGSSWNAGGGGGFSLGFISIGGGGSHSEGSEQSQFNALKTTDSKSSSGWSFDGQKLRIQGTQVVAWLSEILPASAPLDDPTLA